MLNSIPKGHQGGKLHCAVRCSESHTSCSSAKMHLCLTIPCQLVLESMANMTAQSCSIKWGQLFTINNQNCLSMVSFCSTIMEHLNTIVMCKIWCNAGVGRCWHILHTLQISPDVITSCLLVWKNIFGAHDTNRQTMSTLLSLPLYIASARMTRPATDRLPHRWEKCVDSAGDYTEYRTCFWHRITQQKLAIQGHFIHMAAIYTL